MLACGQAAKGQRIGNAEKLDELSNFARTPHHLHKLHFNEVLRCLCKDACYLAGKSCNLRHRAQCKNHALASDLLSLKEELNFPLLDALFSHAD